MTPALELHAIAQFSALRIVASLAEGAAIGVFAALMLRIARRQNAGTRFAVWFSALIAIAALPLVSGGWWSGGGISGASVSRPAITVPDSWAVYLFGAWTVIAAWSLFGIVRALWHLRNLRGSCVPVDLTGLDPVLQETLRRTRMKRTVVLCTSQKVNVPTALGLLKPAIVIPGWALQELSSAELNQILLHELAHLRRWDDWTNLAQQLVRAIFFFHPAVWWIEKQAALEREIACDDAVLAATASPRAYAECLAHLAERSFAQRSLALAQAALGRIRQTSLRVAQILDVNRSTDHPRVWKPAVTMVAAFAIACAVCAARAPRLIAFQDIGPSRGAGQAVAASSPGTIGKLIAKSRNAKAQNSQNQDLRAAQMPAPITAVKLRIPAHKNLDVRAPASVAQSATSRPQAGNMVHLTTAKSGTTKASVVPVSETVFVLIEGRQTGSSDQPVYQIQMWRVLVLRQMVPPTEGKTPRKT